MNAVPVSPSGPYSPPLIGHAGSRSRRPPPLPRQDPLRAPPPVHCSRQQRPVRLTVDSYRYPGERRALVVTLAILLLLTWIVGIIGLLVTIAFVSVSLIGIWLSRAFIRRSLLPVSDKQFPRIHNLVHAAALNLGMSEEPDVFIMQSAELNAFAFGAFGRKSVVLHSALVENMSEEELTFVIGHELSHIKCKHTLWLLAEMGSPPHLLLHLLYILVLQWWLRKAEYTCDRGGLLACHNLEAGCTALAKLALGDKLARSMDVKAFLDQSRQSEEGLLFRLRELLQRHPHTVKRIKRLIEFHQSNSYQNLVTGLASVKSACHTT